MHYNKVHMTRTGYKVVASQNIRTEVWICNSCRVKSTQRRPENKISSHLLNWQLWLYQ